VLNNATELVARTEFTNFGTIPTLVNLIYRIEDSNKNVVYTDNGEVTVTTQEVVIKDFKELNLVSGKYTLYLTTTYGNNVQDEFLQIFEIKAQSTSNEGLSWTIGIVSVLAVILIGGLMYRSTKLNKKSETESIQPTPNRNKIGVL
jgi:hypothetical protein